MTMGVRAVALWCTVVAALVTTAATYTVDTELSERLKISTGKKGGKDEEAIASQQLSHPTLPPFAFTSATISTSGPKNKDISDKFNNNLQILFNPLLFIGISDEMETCKENEIMYKVGEHIDRGCDETCECTATGVFDCSPRCKLPYIRRGISLTDPYCYESPFDECCSVIACESVNREPKSTTIEMCRYGNEAYPVGVEWHIGCEQTCVCDGNSVTCKPRCNRLPLSDKCINVQDSNDECCEVQVCDVSTGVHKKPGNITISSSSSFSTTTSTTSGSTTAVTSSTHKPLST